MAGTLRSDGLAGAALLGLPVMELIHGASFPMVGRVVAAAPLLVLLAWLLCRR